MFYCYLLMKNHRKRYHSGPHNNSVKQTMYLKRLKHSRNVFLIFSSLDSFAYTICNDIFSGLSETRCECLEKDFVLLPTTEEDLEIRFGDSPTTLSFLCWWRIILPSETNVYCLFYFFIPQNFKLFINFLK